MNKHLILTLFGAMAISGSCLAFSREKADLPEMSQLTLKRHLKPGEVLGEMHVGDKTYHVIAPPSVKTRDGEDAPTSVPITPIITHAPGTPQNYIKDIEVAYAAGAPYQGLYGFGITINWDGEDAYFPNIITYAPPVDTYVKASMQNGKLVMPMNQTVKLFTGDDLEEGETEYAMNYGLLRPVFTKGEDNQIYIWYQYSDDYDYVDYKVDNKGNFQLQFQPAKYSYGEFEGTKDNPYLTIPPYAVGYYYNDDLSWTGWTGYCEWTQDYVKFTYPPVEIPSDLSWDTFSYINGEGIGVIVYVGETSDAVYIKGLSAYLPEAAFKADKISYTKISVAPGQYIGNELGLFFVITNTGVMEKNTVYPAPEGTPALFVVTRDDKGKITSISADPDSEYFLVYDDDPGYFYDMDNFRNVTINTQESFAGTPSTPTEVAYAAYGSWLGANYIFFRLSPFAANGDIIDYNKLYYSVFVNGEPYEFEQTEGENLQGEEITMYKGITKATYLVPYTFGNDIDLYEDSGGTFIVGLYAEGIETVGVRSVYEWNGETTYSPTITVSAPKDTKVDEINGEEAVTVEYFDLQGRKVANPSAGIFLKKSTLMDGSVKTTKVVMKK